MTAATIELGGERRVALTQRPCLYVNNGARQEPAYYSKRVFFIVMTFVFIAIMADPTE